MTTQADLLSRMARCIQRLLSNNSDGAEQQGNSLLLEYNAFMPQQPPTPENSAQKAPERSLWWYEEVLSSEASTGGFPIYTVDYQGKPYEAAWASEETDADIIVDACNAAQKLPTSTAGDMKKATEDRTEDILIAVALGWVRIGEFDDGTPIYQTSRGNLCRLPHFSESRWLCMEAWFTLMDVPMPNDYNVAVKMMVAKITGTQDTSDVAERVEGEEKNSLDTPDRI